MNDKDKNKTATPEKVVGKTPDLKTADTAETPDLKTADTSGDAVKASAGVVGAGGETPKPRKTQDETPKPRKTQDETSEPRVERAKIRSLVTPLSVPGAVLARGGEASIDLKTAEYLVSQGQAIILQIL